MTLLTEASIRHICAAKRVFIGFSGGLDSSVLLHCVSQICPSVIALHIHHGLQTQADAWAEHCDEQCQRLSVELRLHRGSLATVGKGVEAAARQLRYGYFEQVLEPGDLLLLAHHRDDQVETWLLRLLRGSGVLGLTAMPMCRRLAAGQLHRPLLDCERSTLLAYAQAHGLEWVEDPSNQQSHYDRNFLRLQVLPLLKSRWPQLAGRILSAIEHWGEAQQLLDEMAIEACQQLESDSLYGANLDLVGLSQYSAAAQRNILRFWLRRHGCNSLSRQRLQALLDMMLHAREDAQPLDQLSDHWQLRRFQQRLWLVHCAGPLTDDARWLSPTALPLTDNGGLWAQASVTGLAWPTAGWRVAYRQGGERLRPLGRGGSASLKKLFQEAGVPPWLRHRWPLLYHGEQLLAVAGLWVDERGLAAAGEAAWQLHWQLPAPCLQQPADD